MFSHLFSTESVPPLGAAMIRAARPLSLLPSQILSPFLRYGTISFSDWSTCNTFGTTRRARSSTPLYRAFSRRPEPDRSYIFFRTVRHTLIPKGKFKVNTDAVVSADSTKVSITHFSSNVPTGTSCLDTLSLCVSERRYPSKQWVFEAAGLSGTFQRVPQYVRVWRDALREHGIQPA